MLEICADTLPQTCLSYLAFRISFQETLERMALARQTDGDCDCYGYLTEVPFLRGVAPHVQLDLLAATWSKHVARQCFEANLVDESVVYAVCERSAATVEAEPGRVRRYLTNGPLDVPVPVDHFLASELRTLHLNLSNEGDFLMISQFEDLRPDEAHWMKRKFRLDQQQLDIMFEVLGRWHMSARFTQNLRSLLSEHEIRRAASFVGVTVDGD